MGHTTRITRNCLLWCRHDSPAEHVHVDAAGDGDRDDDTATSDSGDTTDTNDNGAVIDDVSCPNLE